MKKVFFAVIWSGSFFLSPLKAAEPVSFPPSTSIAQEASASAEDVQIVTFTPPANWQMADPSRLGPHVRAMVVGSGPSAFPPSMNLSCEAYQGTLRQYLKIIKNMNSAQGYEWKDLGIIRTEAGNGNLSQVDTKTQWGDVRLMHVVLIKNGTVYILTASALKNEFQLFYKDFFAAMRSLRIANDVYDMIANPQQRKKLKIAADQLKTQWQTQVIQKQKEYPDISLPELRENVFKSEEFQNETWKPFKEMLDQQYSDLGAEWRSFFLQKLEDQFFNNKS